MEGEERRQRVSLAEARQARAGRPAAAEAYQAARLRFELAEASPRSRTRSPGTPRGRVRRRPGTKLRRLADGTSGALSRPVRWPSRRGEPLAGVFAAVSTCDIM